MTFKLPVAGFKTSLTQRAETTSTIFYLDSVLDDAGNTISGTKGFLIDEGETNEETIIGTVSGSTLITCLRGISPTDGISEVTALKKVHRKNATIKITSHPYLIEIIRALNGTTQFDADNIMAYDAAPAFTPGSNQLGTIKYMDDLALNGAPDASETTKGLFEAADSTEMAAGDDTGTTTAPLAVRPSKLAEVIQKGSYLYFVEDGSGADDAYVGVMTPAITAYTAGMVVVGKLTVANAGACTLDLGGGAVAIKKWIAGALTDLETNDIAANYTGIFEYDGTYFVLLATSAGQLSQAQITTLIANSAYFTAPYTQGVKTSFTTGEAVAAGDYLGVSAADTAVRYSPTSIAPTYDQTSVLAAVEAFPGGGSVAQQGRFLKLSSSLSAFFYQESGAALMRVGRIPITASTGAVGTIAVGSALTTGVTPATTHDAVAMDSTRALVCSSKANSFSAGVLDLTSTVSAGTTAAIDTSNVSEGFCEYISDSHVLFFSRDTSLQILQFAKYTCSSTTLSASATGIVYSGWSAKTWKLKGVRRFGTSAYFLFIIQNATNSRAEALIAHYDTATSTFDVVGTPLALPSSQQLDATAGIYNAVFAECSDTQMIVACPTNSTDGVYLLVYRSDATSTIPLFGTINSMATRGDDLNYSLTKVNAREAFLNSQNSTTLTVRLIEINAAGTDLVTRASTTRTTAATSVSLSTGTASACFQASPTRMGLIALDTNSDLNGGTGTLTLTPPAGVADTAAAISTSVAVTTSGYSASTTGLTAVKKYFADWGGLLTLEDNGTPDKIGVTKDTGELILKSW